MNILDIQGLIDNTATIATKIEILPRTQEEEIVTLTNEDSIKSWVYSDLRNVEKQGFIGQFVARTLDGELQDISDDFNIEDREIILYLGISSSRVADIITQTNVELTTQDNENLSTEQGSSALTYYKLGNFFVEKPESDEVRDSTKFKSMDYTILFNNPFNANFTDSEYVKSFNAKIQDHESVTALWLAQYTCKQVGVVLGTTTFRNSNFVIDSNQFDDGFTCRDVIKNIAKLAVTWARIGWDNKLYLDFDKQTGTVPDYNIITNDNYYELTTQKEVYGEVNRIVMGSSIVVGNSAYIENSQSIEANGLTELDIYDNPILYTQELRETAIANATPMLGLMYQPVDIETTGHPWLLGNELITIVDMEGNYLNTYALDRILTYNGHIRSKINSVTKTETESTYSYQGVENNELEIKRSKVELDRQNQTLTSVMERTTTNESQISSMQQNINGINVNVTSMSGDINNLQGSVSSINSSITDINTSIADISGDISDLSVDLNGLSVSFEDFYDNDYLQTIDNLQDQIDGVIEFWTGDDIPTLNNAPASSWTTEALKQEHMGDVYIVLSGTAQGANYRFVKDGNVWKWLEISDSQIGAVRELAQSALNMATQNALDIVDLQRTDVQFQADLDGITASYSTLNTRVDALGEGYEAITQAEKYKSGNPILITDCGEYLIKNFTIYGNTSQGDDPTPSTPQEVQGVTGEHTLTIYSNNLYHVPNNTQYDKGITCTTEDNIIILNGTSTDLQYGSDFQLNEEPLTLEPGTYTLTCWVEGETDATYIPRIQFRSLVDFYHKTGERNSETFTISEPRDDLYIRIMPDNGASYTNYKIKLQIEKGSTSNDYSNLYIQPTDYTYNLRDLVLHGIGNYKDYIRYDLTDEQWYLHRNIKKFVVDADYVSGFASTSDTRVLITVSTSDGKISDMKSINNTIYCNKLAFKGSVDSESEIPTDEEGLYVRYNDYMGESQYYVYLSVFKTTMGKQSSESVSSTEVKNWVDQQGIVFYYVQETEEVELLPIPDIATELDYIRNHAKLYETYMIVEDIPTETLKGNIGITYFTKTIFNGIYATQSDLKITQNSISTTVSETVSASIQNVTDLVSSLNNTIDTNVETLNYSINELNNNLANYATQSSLITVTNSVEEIQTALNEQINVTQTLKENGVEKVTTTTGFTFDKDGLSISKTGADTRTLVDEDGMTVYSTNGSEESVLLNVDSQGVQTENLHVRTYTQIGSHSRLQDYEDSTGNGTAIFYIE